MGQRTLTRTPRAHSKAPPPAEHGQPKLHPTHTNPSSREHFTRRQLPLVEAAGFEVVEVERLKAGTVERVFARKPTWRACNGFVRPTRVGRAQTVGPAWWPCCTRGHEVCTEDGSDRSHLRLLMVLIGRSAV
jgi:hypothetical protein